MVVVSDSQNCIYNSAACCEVRIWTRSRWLNKNFLPHNFSCQQKTSFSQSRTKVFTCLIELPNLRQEREKKSFCQFNKINPMLLDGCSCRKKPLLLINARLCILTNKSTSKFKLLTLFVFIQPLFNTNISPPVK